MIRFLLKKLLEKNRTFLLKEADFVSGFMHLLMQPRNTGMQWSREEKKKLKNDLRHLSVYVPAIIIFLLPGGSLLLPFLAEILDRRKIKRI